MKDILRFFFGYLKRKPYLIPPVLVILGAIIIATSSTNPVIAPFLYTMF